VADVEHQPVARCVEDRVDRDEELGERAEPLRALARFAVRRDA